MQDLPNQQNRQNLLQALSDAWEAELFVLVSEKKNPLRPHVILAQSRSLPQEEEFNLVQSLNHLALDPHPGTAQVPSIPLSPLPSAAIDSIGEYIADSRDLAARVETLRRIPRPYPELRLQGTTTAEKGQEGMAQLIQEEVHPVGSGRQKVIQQEEESRQAEDPWEAIHQMAMCDNSRHLHHRELRATRLLQRRAHYLVRHEAVDPSTRRE